MCGSNGTRTKDVHATLLQTSALGLHLRHPSETRRTGWVGVYTFLGACVVGWVGFSLLAAMETTVERHR